ncbi:MAG: VWA domain-containing protein [Thermoleophilaceae bacterium]
MSFANPYVLLVLLALPLLAVVYVAEQRRRRLVAQAFAVEKLQPSVAPRRPRWRRHMPVLAFALALAILVGAAAKPQRTIATPVERASIMLATDISGSMTARDVAPNRLVAAKRAARTFLDKVPARVNVGVMGFNQTPAILASPSTDRQAARDAIARMQPSGGTATGDAIATAVTSLRTRAADSKSKKPPPAAIVLLSDGASTSGRDAVAAAKAAGDAGVRVYTVALGTASGTITVPRRDGTTQTKQVPPDPGALARIAEASGGKTFTADTADGLSQVYQQLGSQLGHKLQKREITAAFAGGGLALMLLGGVMSLGWFGRLA